MDLPGKVTKVTEVNDRVLRVEGDCSEMRDGKLWEKREFHIDIPRQEGGKIEQAYYVGRKVRLSIAPADS